MHAERFRQLIDAVEKQPDDLFNMYAWTSHLKCGTAGCAVGSFCLQHPEADLKLDEKYGLPLLPGYADPFAAAAAFFGVTMLDSSHLFDPEEYGEEYDENGYFRPIPKSEVIDRLRAFYESHK